MAMQQYKEINFRKTSLVLIDFMNTIVRDYMRQGYVLTVRQLYYQLVARGVIPNTERSYKSTTSIVNDARMAGLMDWDAIEDRTRSFIRRSRWTEPSMMVDACARQFHMDMWSNQETRVFVIVEKEALAGVLERVCHEFDMPLLAARGYPSGTVLREFAESDIMPAFDEGKNVLILHLGDHDPSGLDMTRDLEERLMLFADNYTTELTLTRIALNMEQIEELDPPPNPAKSTDSRFADYRRKFGVESWELDALEPSYINNLVRENVRDFIDPNAWEERQAEVDDGRELLEAAAAWMQERE